MVFTFPELRYDGKTKQIMLGDQVIEGRGLFRRWSNPDYSLTLKSKNKPVNSGFDRANAIVYDVYLEGPNAHAETMLATKAKPAK